MSTGFERDQIGGEQGVKPAHRLRRQQGQRAAEICKAIHRQHTDPAAIRQNGKPPAGKRLQASERLCGGEQLLEIEYAQEAGPTERCIVHRVRSGKRPGVRLCGLGTLSVAAGFDHHDRLRSCCRARRGHELAGVGDGLDVEQDRAGCAIQGKEVQKIADIHVDHVAERRDRREPHIPDLGPFDHSGHDGARLRDQREVAGLWHAGREACIEHGAGREHADAVWTDEPQAPGAGCFCARVSERARPMAQARRNDNRCCRAFLRRGRHNVWNLLRRSRDDHQIGSFNKVQNRIDRTDSVDLRVMRIDEVELPLEASGPEVSQDRMAGRGDARTRADDRNRARRK
jgi:hypothetical protein